MPLVAILKISKFLFKKLHLIFQKKPQILIVLRILSQSHSTPKVLQFSEKVNPRSYVNKNADVSVIAIGNHQEKTYHFKR